MKSLGILLVTDVHVVGQSRRSQWALDGPAWTDTCLGALAVWGNHDALCKPQGYAPRWLRRETRPLQDMQANLAALGIRMLTSRAVGLTGNGSL